MMDYLASITYTDPGHRRTPCGPSRPPPRAGSSASGARCAGGSTPAGKGYCPIDALELDRRATRSTCPQTGTITNYTIITPVQYPGQTETEPFARVHVLLDGTDVVLGYQPLIDLPERPTSASACASPRCGRRRPRRATRRHLGRLGSLLGWMPDRRARRRRPRPREQDLLMADATPTTSRSSAGRTPMVRRTDQDRDADAARGRSPTRSSTPASPAPTSTSPAPAAATTSPARRSRSCRTSTPSARGRPSATRTSRWTAPGRCTRRGSGCSRATSTSRWRRARAARRPPTRRSSTRWRWTRTTSRRSAPTRRRFAALQARALIDAGMVDRARRWPRSRSAAATTRSATRTRRSAATSTSTTLLADRLRARRRCAATTCRRSPTAPCAMVLATRRPGPRARASDPAWITGFDHRTECHNPAYPRPRATRRRPASPAEAAGLDDGAGRGRRAAGRVHPRGAAAASRRSASATTCRSTRRAARWRRTRSWPPAWSASAKPPDHDHRRRQAARARPLDVGPVPATEPGLHPGGRRLDEPINRAPSSASARPTTRARRCDVSLGGLVREAALRALDDAQMTWADIDAVVLGKAPDLFEGVMKPELYLSDALGAAGKPMFRVHTAGSVGGTTGIVAVAPRRGRHATDGCWRSRFEKQSEGNAQFALGSRARARRSAPAARSRRTSALHPPQRRARAHRADGRGQGPPERAEEPVRAPEDRGHLDREGEGVADDVGPDPLPRVVPVVRRRVRGGAHRRGRRQGGRRRRPAAGVGPRHRRALASRRSFPGRDPVRPQARVGLRRPTSTPRPASPNPREQIDCAELYVPFSWYEPMWLEGHDIAEPRRGLEDDRRAARPRSTASFPVNMSGGVLSSNPIGASGLLRFAEAALQVRGTAGEHQVDGAKVAARPGLRRRPRSTSRMWVVANRLDPFGR